MGNLYGSEYWTYLLPRRVGPEDARALVDNRLPIGVRRAAAIGLIDDHFGAHVEPTFRAEVARRAARSRAIRTSPDMLDAKNRRRAADEAQQAARRLSRGRARAHEAHFFGFDSSYHVARFNFVHKVPRSRTPLYLATHRSLNARPRREATPSA